MLAILTVSCSAPSGVCRMWPKRDKSSRATNTSMARGGGLHLDEDASLTQ